MLDNIITVAELSLITLFAIAGYFYLVCSLIPRLTLHPVWREEMGRARGLRRLTFETGRAVVCEPDPQIRRYIRKYALVLTEGHKFLQCRIDPRIRYLRYDVASFGRGGELLDIVRVCECPTVPGETGRLALPAGTAHAYVILRRVDGMYENRSKETLVKYSPYGVVLTLILTTASTVALTGLAYTTVTRLWTLLYPSLPKTPLVPTLAVAALAGMAVGGWIIFRHVCCNWRLVNR